MTSDMQHNEKQMNEAKLLLNAYYEALYELLEAKKNLLVIKLEELLREETANRWPGDFDEEKYTAYRDACLAFVDERLETYNPIGIQYTFERIRAREAIELELQLNWYDSQAEFEALMEAIQGKVEAGVSNEKVRELADELIKEVGAFPDKSIVTTYEAKPGLGKLPDYVVARVIEEIIA
jgi:hypothetical protein